jgi:beta-galactosidase
VLLVPALYVAGDELLDALEAYARAGGHLVLTFRTGYADEEARARPEPVPARLRDAAGAGYAEYTNLTGPVPVTSAELALPDGAAATGWADAVVPATAQTLVGYEHPQLGRWAAITTHVHGAGRVTYVGTLPNRALAVALAEWLRPPGAAWTQRPETVTVTGARNRDGRIVRFVSNWSWTPAAMPVPVAAEDLLSGAALAAGERLELGAWDVRVLVET